MLNVSEEQVDDFFDSLRDLSSLSKEEQFSLFYNKAVSGSAKYQFYFGRLFFHGYGVEEDSNNAIYWFEKSAKQDFVPAMLGLSHIYYHRFNNMYDGKFWHEKASSKINANIEKGFNLLTSCHKFL